MKLTPIASNQTLLEQTNGTEVLFSYRTPVAGYHPDLGYVRTKKFYSKTTTKHINKYIYDSHNAMDKVLRDTQPATLTFTCKEVEQEVIDGLLET